MLRNRSQWVGLSCMLSLVVAVGLTFLCPTEGRAIPAFSRIYGQSCGACHVAYPKLNAAGEEFRSSGYHRFEGGIAVPKVPPVRVGQQLELPGTVPVSILLEVGWDFHEVKEQRREDGQKDTTSRKSFNLNEAEIMAGGTIGRHVSFFLDVPLAETEFEERDFVLEGPQAPELAFVALNDILVNDVFNLKLGAIELPLGFSPVHRRLSATGYEIYRATPQDLLRLEDPRAVGLKNANKRLRLEDPQLGAELYGNIYPELSDILDLIIRYNVGVTNASARNPDNNQHVAVHSRLEVRYLHQSLGFFGLYTGNTVDQNPPAGFPGRKSRAWRVGPDLSLRFFNEHLNLFSQFLWGWDSSPTGLGVALKFQGGFTEVDYKLPLNTMGDFVALLRFDYVFTSTFDDLGQGGTVRTRPRIFAVTGGLQYFFWEHFKVVVEYTFREEQERLSREESTRERNNVRDHIVTVRFNAAF